MARQIVNDAVDSIEIDMLDVFDPETVEHIGLSMRYALDMLCDILLLDERK